MASAFNSEPSLPVIVPVTPLCRSNDVDRHRGGVDALHPADDHAEIPQRLRRREREQRASLAAPASLPTSAGDPLACTPLATTAYPAGTVMRSTAVA